jgi:triosephosphate isomerase
MMPTLKKKFNGKQLKRYKNVQDFIKPLLAGNWKMNGNVGFWRQLTREIAHSTLDFDTIDTMVAPPFVGVSTVSDEISKAMGTGLALGVQNIHHEESGAYTGETSLSMLKGFKVSYAIVGHSERREMNGESSMNVSTKACASLAFGVTPIVCVGEPLDVQEAGDTESFILRELADSLRGVFIRRADQLVVAYEPVWAIGSGKAATPHDIAPVLLSIRNYLISKYGDIGSGVRILYGGSVKPENTEELMKVPHLNGFLVGGAALKAESFLGIADKMR